MTTPDENGWMPIETAPKDGTQMLLCVAGYLPAVGCFENEREEWEYQDRGDFVEDEHWQSWLENAGSWRPTHWQPLPKPPVSR